MLLRIYGKVQFSKVGAVSIMMTVTYVFPYKVRAFGGKLGQKSSEAPVSGSPLMIHRSGSYLTRYELLARAAPYKETCLKPVY